ncbi:MAG: laccase domain-containing protein [Phycisphaerae bacterium]|nr:polyphenol oxidase family protein [Phycisphaerae bacterium]NUQ46879.1 laccase domain-containing protein [Phycisphaerae bacterium]
MNDIRAPVTGAVHARLDVEPFEDTALLRFPRLGRFDRLIHVITTRPWNMAPHRGPHRELAILRRQRLCAHLGVPFERLTAPDQIHSPHVVRVDEADVGAGRFGRDSAIRFVDGLVCDLPDTPLLQLSGDCPLILVHDPVRHALGTAHASWRGTVAGAAGLLVRRLTAEFGSRPADLWAGIAPCAGAERYEVGAEVRRVALAMLPDADRFFATYAGKLCFDLKSANADALLTAGVPAAQIEVAAECTLSDARFFSHRREGPDAGRFALVAAVRAAHASA